MQQPALWQATATSVFIALCAGAVCVALTLMLLWSSRELRLRQAARLGQALELSGLIILAMPGIVLATGFYLFNETVGLPESPYPLVIMTNALLAILCVKSIRKPYARQR